MRSIVLTLTLALALALTGCISNMGDLKERLGNDEPEEEPVAPAATQTPAATTNETAKVTKAPVARIAIFGANGALVFKSTFQADDPAEMIFVEEKATLNLIASDSEAIEPGATITGFAWTLNGKAVGNARQANVEVGEAGLYAVVLTVTDSHGKADAQSLKLAVAPTPIEVVTELVTDAVVGAEGEGQGGSATFSLALADAGVPATITSVSFKTAPPSTCDVVIDVTGPDGESVGSDDSGSLGGADEVLTGPIAEGDYAIALTPLGCVAPEGVPITVTVTFLPIVEELAAGAGHGDAGH